MSLEMRIVKLMKASGSVPDLWFSKIAKQTTWKPIAKIKKLIRRKWICGSTFTSESK